MDYLSLKTIWPSTYTNSNIQLIGGLPEDLNTFFIEKGLLMYNVQTDELQVKNDTLVETNLIYAEFTCNLPVSVVFLK